MADMATPTNTEHISLPSSSDRKSVWLPDYVDKWSKTIWPAATMSVMCNGGLAMPSRPWLAWYTAVFSIAGFITYHEDFDNAAGFSTAWSSTYLFLNGKAALPALGNTLIYGERAIHSWTS
ncbi:hypothetical protein BDF19DRAFT_445118 [Syncephalis fuscata]|nr:hypothetical protein BDF19DRAFT_445118 [Syncephalis fuscata]